jgi:hypothetical protein
MKQHLKSASERYLAFKQKEFKINPISSVDAEIIVELSEIIKKLDKPNIKSILDQWKYLSDEEVRDMLMQANLDLAACKSDGDLENPLKNTFKPRKIKFLRFMGKRLVVDFIIMISTKEGLNITTRNYEYKIIINEDVAVGAKMGALENIEFIFFNEESRDIALVELDTLLEGEEIEFIG